MWTNIQPLQLLGTTQILAMPPRPTQGKVKWLNNYCCLGLPNLGKNQSRPSLGSQRGEESKWLHKPCLLGIKAATERQPPQGTPGRRSPRWHLAQWWWGHFSIKRSPSHTRRGNIPPMWLGPCRRLVV